MARKSEGTSDPVDDFLFTYYSYRPAHLLRWHPGLAAVCGGASAASFLDHRGYRRVEHGVTLDPAEFVGRARSARWIVDLLHATSARPPTFGCFGMHEWAMVYRSKPGRAASLVVAAPDERRIRSRRWSKTPAPAAPTSMLSGSSPRRRVPSTRYQLTRRDQLASEQPGCLHAGMDLYKWAYKLSPLTGSDLVADCFELAREIRTVDMQASPYDLTAAGHRPIRVETEEGRSEYVAHQRRFAERAGILRLRLLADAESIAAALADVSGDDVNRVDGRGTQNRVVARLRH